MPLASTFTRAATRLAHDQHGFLGPGAASAGNSNRAGHPADHLSEKRYRMIRNCCMVVLAQLTVPGSVRKVQQRALCGWSWYAGDEAITGSFGEDADHDQEAR